MAKLKTEVILTMNGQSAVQVLEAIQAQAADIAKEMMKWDPKTSEYKELQNVYKSLASAQESIINSNERLDHAVQNLASTSLQNLRRALGAGKRDLDSLSEAEMAQAESIRSMMRTIGDQIRLLEGRYVKIREGLADIGSQSDQWLDKAIKQQNELMSATRRGTQQYQEQKQVMQMLTTEQEKRNAAIRAEAEAKSKDQFKTKVSDARQTLSSESSMQSHSYDENRSAIDTLKQAQRSVAVGSDEWKQYAEEIKEAEANLDKLTGKAKEVKEGLSLSDVQQRMQSLGAQSEKSLKEMLSFLTEVKNEMVPYTDSWNAVNDQIAQVKQRMEEVKNATPYVQDVESAKAIAGNDKLNMDDGTTHDVTRKDLVWAKDKLQKELDVTPVADTEKIAEIKEALSQVEERLQSVSGAADKSVMSAEELDDVLSNIKTASLQQLQTASKELSNQLEQLAPSSEEAKELRKHLQDIDKEIKQVENDVVDVNDVLERSKKGKASLDELKKAYKQLETELQNVNTGSEEYQRKMQQMKNLRKVIDNATGAVNAQTKAWSTAVRNLSAYTVLFKSFDKVKDLLTGVIRKNFEYSSSLTDIRKVSGLTEEQINSLSTKLAKIDTRTSVDALAQLAYQGAKLGMGKYGVEGMEGFVRAADQINVAIGEELGEDALPALSKLVETMGLIPKMGIEQAMLSTGSAMFRLSSTSTATSGNIVEFAKRLTGVARTAGITTDQLLGLASASDSLYLMPEVASTAMSKFVVALQRNHNLIEKDLEIPAGTINNLYSAGNAIDAVVLVLEKMRDKGNMNALGSIFKDLGSDGQRLVTAMVTMSKNVDVLKDHLYESSEAFSEATAVTDEYQMQQQSAIGILERANNLWEKAFVNPEGVNMTKEMATAWYDMSNTILTSPVFKGSLSAAIQMVAISVKTLMVLLPGLISFFVSQGLVQGVIYFVNLSKAIYGAVTAQKALNAAMKANIFVAIATAVLTVAGVVWSYCNAAQEAAKAEEDMRRKANAWRGTLQDAQRETDTLTRKLNSYKVALEASTLSQQERAKQIARFNRDFRSYINKLGIEVKSVNDLKNNYKALSEEIQRATYYRLREQAKDQVMPAYQKDRLAAHNKTKGSLSRFQELGSHFTIADVERMMAEGHNSEELYRMIMQSVASNVKKGSVSFGRDGSMFYTNNKGWKIHQTGDKDLLSSLRYLWGAINREKRASANIDKAYEDFVPKDYQPWQDDEPGTLENEQPDKAEIRAAAQEQRDKKRAWREELKQKQDEVNAVMDNVVNFYERQINAKMEQAVGLGMDKTEQDLFVEPVKKRMNDALENVRLAIAGQKNAWEDFKQSMRTDLVEKTDETGVNLSENLLKDITSVSIDDLRNRLSALSNNLSRPLDSVLSEVFAKATKNAQANLKLEVTQREERRKVAREHDYTGVVKQNMYDDFNTMGYANPNETELSDTKMWNERKKAIVEMFETARKSISDIYALDMKQESNRRTLLSILFGNDTADVGSRLRKTLGDSEAEWEAFYLKLVQYSDQYVEAEKKIYDEAKKVTDQKWAVQQRNLRMQQKLRELQNESNLFGKKISFLSNLGLADVEADPEIALMKARMQAAENYFAFVRKNSQNQQLRDEADKARMEAETNYVKQMASAMKDRLSLMKSLVNPIEQFGSSMGSALAQMATDAESANDAIKSALKSMIEAWGKMAIDDVNSQMWKAINDAGVRRASKNAQPDINAARENAEASAAEMDLYNLGTAENPMWVRIAGAQVLDTNGSPVYGDAPTEATVPSSVALGTEPTSGGEAVPGTDGAASQDIPRAQMKRQRGWGDAFAQTGSEVGAAVADAATGGSFGDAAAGIVGSAFGATMNAQLGGGKKSGEQTEKEQTEAEKKERKHQKALTKEKKKGEKDRVNLTKQGSKEMAETTDAGNKEQSKSTELAQDAMNTAIQTGMTMQIQTKKSNDQEVVESSKETAQAETTFSMVGAIAKCFEFLGPIAGPIAAAVVTSTLMGLMQWAVNSVFSGGSSSNNSTTKKPNTKLVSGMLTYDSGNVQDLKPFVADDGEIYWANEGNAPRNGVSLLSSPTAMDVNGRQSLVAERGPEIVIGRETTRAMMMNNPSLLKALVNYDSGYSGRRALDGGNVSAISQVMADGVAAAVANVGGDAGNLALLTAVNALMDRLNQPINAQINMYGRGGLYENMNKANQFMKGR